MNKNEKCSHGVPLFPKQDCRECNIVWEQRCIADATENLRKHQERLAQLTGKPAAGQQTSDPLQTFEGYNAIRQAHEIASSDEYFGARYEGFDTGDRRNVFTHGFYKGFDARHMMQPPTADVRNQALEEAAAWCQLVAKDWAVNGDSPQNHSATYLARTIRALKTAPSDGWLPIETAPIGVEILVWTDCGACVAYVHGDKIYPANVTAPHDYAYGEVEFIGTPTHWQPLPAAPKGGE